MRKLTVSCFGLAAMLAPTLAMALVGQTSTAAGGDPIFYGNQPQYSGVVTLIIRNGAGPASVCTGALLANRVSVLTSGHCVSHGGVKASAQSVTAYFAAPNAGPNVIVAADPTSTAVKIGDIRVDPLYSGQPVDENDLAVLTLSTPPPVSAMGYGLYAGNAIGQDYTIAGYGYTSSVGGSIGVNAPPGLLRIGTNTFDYALGDPSFHGAFEPGGPGAFGTAADGDILVSDFDDGTSVHNSDCALAGLVGATGARFCGLGTGPTEVATAPGDSGAPNFIDGEIAGVSSFGFALTGLPAAGRFGEIDGSAPTAPQSKFIESVPEPTTWAMLLIGFGVIGVGARRVRARSIRA